MRRRRVRASAVLALLLIGITVLGPFAWASTLDSFLYGIHDAESDDVLQGGVSFEGVAYHAPAPAIEYAPVVLAIIAPSDDGARAPIARSAFPPRAPPRT